jgi:hypothetical protein
MIEEFVFCEDRRFDPYFRGGNLKPSHVQSYADCMTGRCMTRMYLLRGLKTTRPRLRRILVLYIFDPPTNTASTGPILV